MKTIKEYLDNKGNPIILVSSFYDSNGNLHYVVDSLFSCVDITTFEDKEFALDYAQAKTNHINRKLKGE